MKPSPADPRITDGARLLRAYLTAKKTSVPTFCERHKFCRIQMQRVLNGERWRRITVDFAFQVERATGGAIPWTKWLSKTGRVAIPHRSPHRGSSVKRIAATRNAAQGSRGGPFSGVAGGA